MPQWAVMGLPGQTGQASPAALSQTVKMKSKSGAPGLANSSHDLDRNSDTAKPRPRNSLRVLGFTSPLGWLPALQARNPGPPTLFKIASAIMDRAELPVHRNRTL